MALFLGLDAISLDDLLRAGGKAARLGEARQLGCPVPPGVVLTTEVYHRYMQQGGLQGEIISILDTLQPNTMAHFMAAEWAIHSAFRVRRVPDDVVRAIEEAWSSLGGRHVAVRSSATREDSPAHSFVGQHETALDIGDRERLIEAVIKCWMSLYSAKALSYAQRFGLELESSSMAVLLQDMVDIAGHGALFTVNPITGNPDQFVLEVRRGPQQGVHTLDPFVRSPGESAQWSQLRELGLRLDEHHRAFQALEWATDPDGQLVILRVRPVTGVPAFLPPVDVQASEVQMPVELLTPDSTHPEGVRPLSWYHMSRSAQLKRAFRARVMGLAANSGPKADGFVCGYPYARWEQSPVQALAGRRLPRVLQELAMSRMIRQCTDELSCVWAWAVDEYERLTVADLSKLGAADLLSHHRAAMRLHEGLQTQLDAFASLSRHHRRMASSDAPGSAQGPSEGGGQPTGCPAAVSAVDECYLVGSVDYCSPAGGAPTGPKCAAWADTDTWRLPSSPFESRSAGQNGGTSADAALARWEQRAQARAQRTEAAKLSLCHLVARCLTVERQVVWEVGRRLVLAGVGSEPSDACLLGCQELDAWLSGALSDSQAIRLVIERRQTYRRWTRYVPPRMLEPATEPEPDVVLAARLQQGRSLSGQPVSRGVAFGRARVLYSLGQMPSLLPDEVLVCTEPLFELSLLFDIVVAVVAESGGLLDHAGVLAREYGVPAVFGVAEATREIRTGDDLYVDARTGVVTVLAQASTRGPATAGGVW